MPITGIELAGIGATLFGSLSAVAGFFFKYGIKLALVEKTANDASSESKQNGKDIAATTSRVNTLESLVSDIRNSLAMLNVIPRIEASLSGVKESIADLKEQVAEVRGHIVK